MTQMGLKRTQRLLMFAASPTRQSVGEPGCVGTDADDLVDVLVRIRALLGNVVGGGDADDDALGVQVGEDGLRDGAGKGGALFATALVPLLCMLGILGEGVGGGR